MNLNVSRQLLSQIYECTSEFLASLDTNGDYIQINPIATCEKAYISRNNIPFNIALKYNYNEPEVIETTIVNSIYTIQLSFQFNPYLNLYKTLDTEYIKSEIGKLIREGIIEIVNNTFEINENAKAVSLNRNIFNEITNFYKEPKPDFTYHYDNHYDNHLNMTIDVYPLNLLVSFWKGSYIGIGFITPDGTSVLRPFIQNSDIQNGEIKICNDLNTMIQDVFTA